MVALQTPNIAQLKKNLDSFDRNFTKMLESSKEYKGDFNMQFNQNDIQNNLRGLLNHHVHIQFPGLERGFFPEVKK